MAKIKLSKLAEVIPSLPEIQSFDPLHWQPEKSPAIFLCALGFEPRCLTVPSALGRRRYKAARAIYFEYATNRDDNAANRPQLLECLSAISQNVQSLEVDDHGFRGRLGSVLEAATQAGHEPLVILDISVAANRLLMRVMNTLLRFDIHLTVLYSEAAIYHPTRTEYQREPERWELQETLGLERGVSDVTLGEDYPGYHVDQLPDCVILFPSFNRERSRAVISEIDPSLLTAQESNVLWLLGVPRLADDRWRLEAMRKINGLSSEVTSYDVSTFDYRDTLRTLERIYQEKVEQYKFTLSCMGSKMQALGAGLFYYLRPDVRVAFAVPKEYNAAQYSEGCKATWMLDFGSTRELRSVLDQVDMLTVEE